jgi:hypothetical protein
LTELSMQDLANSVKDALGSADLEAYADLLDPKAQWGAPDDTVWGCHSREEVLAWYARARKAGVRARVTEVVIGDGALLVGLRVSGTEEAEEGGGEVDRWQVLTIRRGRVADIRGFDDRAIAAERAGVRGERH